MTLVQDIAAQQSVLGERAEAHIEIGPYEGDRLYFPFDRISVNGNLFQVKKTAGDVEVRHYSPKNAPTACTSEVMSFIEVFPSEKYLGGAFVSKRVLVNGFPFVRRCENFYTPRNLNERHIIRVFNHMATRYNALIDESLNRNLIKRIFKYIQRAYAPTKRTQPVKGNTPFTQMSMILSSDYPQSSSEECQNPTTRVQILDYGVGTGLSYEVYKRKRVETKDRIDLLGCDISPKMLQVCKQLHPDFDVELCSYDWTPYREAFDVVIAVFVTHYFWDIKPYKEISRILRPGGLFISNFHNGFLSSSEEQEFLLARAGFRGVKHRIWHIKSAEKERAISMFFAEKPKLMDQDRRSARQGPGTTATRHSRLRILPSTRQNAQGIQS